MKENHSPQTLDLAMAWLNQAPRGLALCDKAGKFLYENDLFTSFDIPNVEELILHSTGLNCESFDHPVRDKSIRITLTKMDGGYAIVAEDLDNRLNAREQTIANLVTEDSATMLESAAKSISTLSGWRWVAISRFKDNHTAELLYLFDQEQMLENYVYELMGTPCEVVHRTKQFGFFPHLMERFPYYKALHDMGAKVYAGMIYRVNGVAIGHVFAMHDESEVDAALIEDVLRLSTLIIGNKLEVGHANVVAENALREASLDSLTNTLNRRSFDQDIEVCIGYAKNDMFSDTLLGVIDLDGMKQINDSQGHDAGDRLLITFSEALTNCSRPEDKIYRLGGDEFAIILNGAGLAQLDNIISRVEQAVKTTQRKGFPNIDASIGFASLSEAHEDANTWFKLADSRMYEHKKSKKQADK